jgi:hypothetical protein
MGDNAFDGPNKLTLSRHGENPAEWPEELRVRDCPEHLLMAL